MTGDLLVLASGDHHYKRGDRWVECLRIHAWILDEVRHRRPALFVSTGDLYDGPSTPEERIALASFLVGVAEVCPVLVCRGNHDRPRDLELLGGLASRFPITVEEGAGGHLIRTPEPLDREVGPDDIVTDFTPIAVGAFAWPSRPSIMRALGARSSEEVGALGREALRSVFRGLGDRLRLEAAEGRRTILVGHAHVVSATVQEDGQPLPFGEQIAVGLEDLELAGAEATLLGHIHLAQRWDRPAGPIAYCGSPFRNTFGEADAKSITSLRFLGSGGVELERIPTPAAPMVLIRSLEELEAKRGELTPDAEVRLRYDVQPQDREAAAAAVAAATGGLDVSRLKIEERVQSTTVARAPEVAAARGTAAQLVELWKRGGDEDLAQGLESPTVRRALARLAELEVSS